MTNSDDNKSYREVRQETSTDNDGNTHTNVTKTSETGDNSAANYQSGYVQGRTSEHNYEEALAQRDDENTSRGLLIGVVLAGLAALIGSAFWYFNQSSQTIDSTVAPATSAPIYSPSPVVTQTPQPQQTTIIERTKEVPVKVPVEKTKEVPVFIPVPQQAAPAPANTNKAPNINITVPPQQPATKTPATQVSPTPSSSSSSSSNSTPSTTSTTSQSGESIEPSQDKQEKADVTTDGTTTEKSN